MQLKINNQRLSDRFYKSKLNNCINRLSIWDKDENSKLRSQEKPTTIEHELLNNLSGSSLDQRRKLRDDKKLSTIEHEQLDNFKRSLSDPQIGKIKNIKEKIWKPS